MDKIKKLFDRKIIELSMILLGIYVVLYILKVDLHLVITAIIFLCYFYYLYITRK